ncbi:hypothetical protein A0H81_03752 [Grifola frondosa]|uniref:Uncharacterized protein n=1 Tax=Grifola frondosa TaxID=5627 RepID=A0A1C7MKR3_GRIFR|nr:hypothetical protein A0H81_03752 [Grifola frondosa]
MNNSNLSNLLAGLNNGALLDDDELDDPDWEPDTDEEDSFRHWPTAQRARWPAAVLEVLRFMRSKDLDLPLLLWALSWNVPALVTDLLAKYERTSLLVSAELPDILSKWYKPPVNIAEFSLDCVQTVANREMCKVGQFMQRSPDELSEEELLAIKWDDLKQTVPRRRRPSGHFCADARGL